MIQDFITESLEHIEGAESALLELESNPENEEVLNQIFRSFHTIKGMAGFLNLTDIGSLAHTAENLLDMARKGMLRLVGSNCDAVFASIDMLKTMMEDLSNAIECGTGVTAPAGMAKLVTQLKDCINIGENSGTAPAEQVPAAEPQAEETSKAAQESDDDFFEDTAPQKETTDADTTEVIESAPIEVKETAPEKKATVYPNPQNAEQITSPEQLMQFIAEVHKDDNPTEEPAPGKPVKISSQEQLNKFIANVHQEESRTKPTIENTAVPATGKNVQSQNVAVKKNAPTAETIKVSTLRLDDLINMTGELAIAQLMIVEEVKNLVNADSDLYRKVAHQNKIVRELQELSMSMRMVPIQGAFQRMVRLVRDLSKKANKPVQLITYGEDTELDRTIVDKITDPLVHMMRNSVDHGIEPVDERKKKGKPAQGTVILRAYHQAGNIVIEIKDDGKGLNREKILKKAIERGIVQEGRDLSDEEIFKLIFQPGFSTADKITDVSGRGVGMDVVRKNIESLGGKIDIRSTQDKGTTFTIRMPLTLAIIDGQVVSINDQRYIIPINSVLHSLRPTKDQISTIQNKGEVVMVRDKLIPLLRLGDMFNIENPINEPTEALVVVVEEGDRKCCLLVDDLLGQQQVVIKSLTGLGKIKGVSGGAIMGDGRVSLILDVPGLIELSQNNM